MTIRTSVGGGFAYHATLSMSVTGQSQAWLEHRNGERLLLEATCNIGRASDNRLVLRDERVSRRHALIHLQGEDEWWLVDLGSSNGTYVNRGRVSQPLRLRDGDQLEFGPFGLVFRQSDAPGATAAELTTEHTVLDLRASACWLLVADVAGSTLLSQRMADEELAVLMGRWFSACQQLVGGNGGIINKYLGDGFLAYWPHAETARAGLLTVLEEFKRLQEAGSPPFRFVVHHGQVLMGGRASLGEESLSGKEVNFVFRMEKLAGRLKLARLMSEPARRLLADALVTTEAGKHTLPGFPGASPFATF